HIGPGLVVGPVMGRKRQYGRRKARFEVAVLLPPVTNEYEVAPPTGGRRRRDRELQPKLIACIHDDVPIINTLHQLADVSEARVVAGKVAPARRDVRQPAVDRFLRRLSVCLRQTVDTRSSCQRRFRKTAIAKVGTMRLKAGGSKRYR